MNNRLARNTLLVCLLGLLLCAPPILAQQIDLRLFLEPEALDTEAELETQLGDVTDVFTNNDGSLADDDVTLGDVQAATSSDFHNIGGVDLDTGPLPDCVGTTTYQDGEGNCDDLSTVYQAADADLDDLADGSLTGTKVGFADTNSDFAATEVQSAIEELVAVNGSGPNAADGKVEWSQLAGVPAGFADGTDNAGGGAFSDASDPVVLNTTTKDVSIGPTHNNTAKLSVDGDADQVQLSVQGVAGQTANLVVVEDSAGTDFLTMLPTGTMGINDATPTEAQLVARSGSATRPALYVANFATAPTADAMQVDAKGDGTADDVLITAAGLLTTNRGISSPGAAADTQVFGPGAIAPYVGGVAIGKNADAGHFGVAIGTNAIDNFNATVSPGQGNVLIGYGATSSAKQNVAIGNNASTTSSQGIAIGSNTSTVDGIVIGGNASGYFSIGFSAVSSTISSIAIGDLSNAGQESTAVGDQAVASLQRGTAIGQKATAGSHSIAIGVDATNAGFSKNIAMGRNATNTTNSEWVVGGDGYEITSMFIGEGVTNATPLAVSINATGGAGTNIAGANLRLAGGRSTGSGLGGSLLFQTSPAGGSGSAANALATRLTIASTGAVTISQVLAVTPRATPPTAIAGGFYVDSDLNLPCFYNGTNWVQMNDYSTICS